MLKRNFVFASVTGLIIAATALLVLTMFYVTAAVVGIAGASFVYNVLGRRRDMKMPTS